VRSAPAEDSNEGDAHVEPEHSHRGEKQKKRRMKKKGVPMLLLVFGWSALMAGIILFANHRWKGAAARQAEWGGGKFRSGLTNEDYELLNRYAEFCHLLIMNVVAHNRPEEISQFVLNAPTTFSDMARFYRMNPGTQILEPQLQREAFSVIRLPEGTAIEGRWQTGDGRVIEAVFRDEGDGLLLDWHHFVRYSDLPLGLFLAGNGPDEAEFRLLARQRLTRMVLDDAGERPMSVVFYPPRFGFPMDPGPPSPPIDLDWHSDAARKLLAGLEQARAGRKPFQSLLPAMESDDEMIRVRVVLRRIEEEDGERRFEIVEVRSCHWLEHEDFGIPGQPDPE